jgi:hypothetical protein
MGLSTILELDFVQHDTTALKQTLLHHDNSLKYR